MNEWFRKLAIKVSAAAGKPHAFFAALLVIVVWACTGPIFNFSNTWQLFINTGTTIVTLLMVFLIQNTQNRDSKAMHLKLDELLKSISHARNVFIDVEDMPDEEIERLHKESQELQRKYKEVIERKAAQVSGKK
ncbi:low affinity iron permease family protein [Candidatus Microgenomates bacterium]|nr:MAG: low affinity iron permease family protein [Candidatus Microgenomates bacterium]